MRIIDERNPRQTEHMKQGNSFSSSDPFREPIFLYATPDFWSRFLENWLEFWINVRVLEAVPDRRAENNYDASNETPEEDASEPYDGKE